MVSNIDIVRLLKQKFPDLKFYPALFPVDAPEIAGTVDLFSPSSLRSGLFSMVVTIKLRANHPKDAEGRIIQIIKDLDGLRDVQLGQAYLLTVQATNPVPRFLGTGQNGSYLYSTDFKFMLDVVQ